MTDREGTGRESCMIGREYGRIKREWDRIGGIGQDRG